MAKRHSDTATQPTALPACCLGLTVPLWRSASGPNCTASEHGNSETDLWYVDHVCWGSRGTRFLTAGSNVVRLWDLRSLRMLCDITSPPDADIDKIWLLADDGRIVCKVRDGRLFGWTL